MSFPTPGELLFLIGVVGAFGLFGVTLLGVSIWVALGKEKPSPAASQTEAQREVVQAKRAA